MIENLFFYGIRKRTVKSAMWVVALFCYLLLINPLNAKAETCATIDYNKSTIAAGAFHTVGLKEGGTVVAVGDNSNGQLNVSHWRNIKAIAAGWVHTVGLKEDGTVLAVGNNSNGQLNVLRWRNIRQPACAVNNLDSLPGFISALPDISEQSVNSLTSKVENAIAAFNSGNETAAVNMLNALFNEISAQTGNKIPVDAADTLTAYIENIITAIEGG